MKSVAKAESTVYLYPLSASAVRKGSGGGDDESPISAVTML